MDSLSSAKKNIEFISIITPCYNEEDNISDLHLRVKEVFSNLKDKYTYEHIFIDNNSKDNSAKIIRKICLEDPNTKAILNSRNFGHIRSPVHALFQSTGDAGILLACDFQDPPELIPNLLKKREEGFLIVKAIKIRSEENICMFLIRKAGYYIIPCLISSFTRREERSVRKPRSGYISDAATM